MAEAPGSFGEIQDKILQHAHENAEFRQELLSDPKGTLEKYTGQKLPADGNVYVHEIGPKELHLVVPAEDQASDVELSDEELESVAGGEVALSVGLAVAGTVVGFGLSVGYSEGKDAGW